MFCTESTSANFIRKQVFSFNESGQSILALIKAENLLSDEVLADVLSVQNMVHPKQST
jgi:aspartate ammonia-lyase